MPTGFILTLCVVSISSFAATTHFGQSPIAVSASLEKNRYSLRDSIDAGIVKCERPGCPYGSLLSDAILVDIELKNVSERNIELRETDCRFTDDWGTDNQDVRLIAHQDCPGRRFLYRKLEPGESLKRVVAITPQRRAVEDLVGTTLVFRLGFRTHVPDDGRYWYRPPDDRIDYSPDGAGPYEILFWSNQLALAVVE